MGITDRIFVAADGGKSFRIPTLDQNGFFMLTYHGPKRKIVPGELYYATINITLSDEFRDSSTLFVFQQENNPFRVSSELIKTTNTPTRGVRVSFSVLSARHLCPGDTLANALVFV